MIGDFSMVISRGKVTFTKTTATRCSKWELLSSMDDPEAILDIMEDVLHEFRPENYLAPPYQDKLVQDEIARLSTREPADEIPVSDGVAFQPPKQTVVGGFVDLGHSEPSSR